MLSVRNFSPITHPFRSYNYFKWFGLYRGTFPIEYDHDCQPRMALFKEDNGQHYINYPIYIIATVVPTICYAYVSLNSVSIKIPDFRFHLLATHQSREFPVLYSATARDHPLDSVRFDLFLLHLFLVSWIAFEWRRNLGPDWKQYGYALTIHARIFPMVRSDYECCD